MKRISPRDSKLELREQIIEFIGYAAITLLVLGCFLKVVFL
ncbi:MAG: hypothetical protein R2879_06570 [Saprospiraceae bacterium]